MLVLVNKMLCINLFAAMMIIQHDAWLQPTVQVDLSDTGDNALYDNDHLLTFDNVVHRSPLLFGTHPHATALQDPDSHVCEFKFLAYE
jgi:hypothetical protein